MNPEGARFELGAQIWLEQTDDSDRVRSLVRSAKAIGLSQLRTFLMWPWIQPANADEWDFGLFDSLFEAAAEEGLTIKATLTANSGPWWLGTPSVLHSHTMVLDEAWWPAVESYVRACASRYRGHPALGQWILWNEPSNPLSLDSGASLRPSGSRTDWQRWLERRVGDIGTLNARWRTGYASFDEVDLPEEVAHPYHRKSPWQSFGPELLDARFRADQLDGQLRRIAEWVRSVDSETPLCVNPDQLIGNHAQAGIQLGDLAATVGSLGASFHAPWHFSFARQLDHPALMLAGLSMLRTAAGGRPVEVTEFQLGHTYYAGQLALGANPEAVALGYLAPILAGAASVTGWCLNARGQDFEVGEWGLLDDDDQAGDRAGAVVRVRAALETLTRRIGVWTPDPATCIVLSSEDAQSVELALSRHSNTELSGNPASGVQGAALIDVEVGRHGLAHAMAPVEQWSADGRAEVVIAAGISAWTIDQAEDLLAFARSGGTLVLDATSGRFTPDAGLHRPWPGGMGTIGLRGRGLSSSETGDLTEAISLHGAAFGRVAGVRSDIEIVSSEWTPDPAVTFTSDSSPVIWSRSWGKGRIVYVCTSLPRSLLLTEDSRGLIHYVLDLAPRSRPSVVRPLSPATTALGVEGERGRAILLFASPLALSGRNRLSAVVAPGIYEDLWNGRTVRVDSSGRFRCEGDSAIALLVSEHSAASR